MYDVSELAYKLYTEFIRVVFMLKSDADEDVVADDVDDDVFDFFGLFDVDRVADLFGDNDEPRACCPCCCCC